MYVFATKAERFDTNKNENKISRPIYVSKDYFRAHKENCFS